MRVPRRGVSRLTLVVVALGLLLTVALVVAARTAYDENEDRLLEQRTQEGAAVLAASVANVQSPLAEIATLAGAVADDDPDAVQELIEASAGVRFSVISVHRPGIARSELGTGEPKFDLTDETIGRWVEDAVEAEEATLRVLDLLELPDPRIGYVYATPGPDAVVVYGEQPTPPDRRSQTDRGEAFEDLHHLLYLGTDESPEHLIFGSPEDLRIDGRRSSVDIPFGDNELRLVMSPMGQLGGRLLALLPWLVGAGGVVSALVGAALVEGLHRRRRDAEVLAEEVEELYGREHAIAHTLQQSLLPSLLPTVTGAEIAVRYVAGASGTEVGGDWYDVIDLGARRVALIVGDVAGKGVQAAAIMAAMRYGTHAIAAQDVEPGAVLAGINRLEGIRGDFVTMVCGVLDVGRRTVAVSSAGHPPPLVIEGDDARFVSTPVGPPVGFLKDIGYDTDTATIAPGATLLMFTDGLYERPGEDLDVGLERLRSAAVAHRGSLPDLLEHIRSELVGTEGRDDIAMLAIRLDD
jgi:serine phosphatase RsbU (regulator of sigma subunit)